jgi:Glyoxalase/Bleomycin resistance protein/Dioxygenase superfamily
VLVVWEPILATDWRQASGSTLGRIADGRARQFWDPKHVVSAELKDRATQTPPQPKPNCERARMKMEQIGKGTTWVFRADNLDKTYQELSARGVKFMSPPKALPWGRQAIFEDLYGNQYALMGK